MRVFAVVDGIHLWFSVPFNMLYPVRPICADRDDGCPAGLSLIATFELAQCVDLRLNGISTTAKPGYNKAHLTPIRVHGKPSTRVHADVAMNASPRLLLLLAQNCTRTLRIGPMPRDNSARCCVDVIVSKATVIKCTQRTRAALDSHCDPNPKRMQPTTHQAGNGAHSRPSSGRDASSHAAGAPSSASAMST